MHTKFFSLKSQRKSIESGMPVNTLPARRVTLELRYNSKTPDTGFLLATIAETTAGKLKSR